MTVHISRHGINEDDEGFYSVRCDCGVLIGRQIMEVAA